MTKKEIDAILEEIETMADKVEKQKKKNGLLSLILFQLIVQSFYD